MNDIRLNGRSPGPRGWLPTLIWISSGTGGTGGTAGAWVTRPGAAMSFGQCHW